MAIYRYQPDSLVDAIQLITNEKGGKRAYLYADNAADTEKLRLVKQGLRAEGYKCVPTLNDGKPVLEVRGFTKPEELLNYLSTLKALRGQPQITAEESDTRSADEKARNASLKLAGISYNIGDASYLTYAYRQYRDEKVIKVKGDGNHINFFNKMNIFAGIGYTLGSSALSLYGSKDQSLNTINTANKKIFAHLRQQNVEVSEDSTLKAAMSEKDRGIFGNAHQFLAKYPSEVFNSIYVFVGGALMAAAAYRATRPIAKGVTALEKAAEAVARKEQKDEIWDIGLGVVTASSALVGLTVKEKKPDEDAPKRHGAGRIIDYIQEKPLRATGIGYMVSTVLHGIGTYKKYQLGNQTVKKTAIYRGIFVAANVVSELLLSISSKGHGVGVKPDDSVDQSVVAATAELIMRQPFEKREAMIQNMAGFMSSRDVLGGKSEAIAADLRRHIEALANSPWTKHYVPNAKGEMVEAAPVQPALNTSVETMTKGPEKPTSVVSNAEHLSRQQPLAHALT